MGKVIAVNFMARTRYDDRFLEPHRGPDRPPVQDPAYLHLHHLFQQNVHRFNALVDAGELRASVPHGENAVSLALQLKAHPEYSRDHVTNAAWTKASLLGDEQVTQLAQDINVCLTPRQTPGTTWVPPTTRCEAAREISEDRKADGERYSRFPPFGHRHHEGLVTREPWADAAEARVHALADQGLSYRKIAQALFDEGLTPKRFSPSTIGRVLRRLREADG